MLPAQLRAAYTLPDFTRRLCELALERTVVHAAAPPLLPAPVPDPATELPAGTDRAVAVLYDQPLAFTHELYPLWTDAYVQSLADPDLSGLEVIGAHNSWLDEAARVQRAIRYDAANDLLLVGGTLRPGPDGLRRTPAYDCAADRWISLRIAGQDPSGKRGRNVSLGLMYDTTRKLFWAVDTNSRVYVLRLDPKTADPQPLK